VVLFVRIPIKLASLATFRADGVTHIIRFAAGLVLQIVDLFDSKSKFLFKPGKPGGGIEGDEFAWAEFKGTGLVSPTRAAYFGFGIRAN
jgi:hypothetical protein